MGLLFKLFRTFILPLLFFSVVRSVLQDMMRKASSQGGARRNWNSGESSRAGWQSSSSASRSAYEVFNLPRSATNDQIRARYRELISKYHPDKFAGLDDPEFSRLAAEKFQQIQGAYEELRRQRGM